ncbi:MAG: hypothetical protein EBY39_08560 [Flavobacteriia bacterium]|nr:hypothetical protein [Flavobacteriia bacterium]
MENQKQENDWKDREIGALWRKNGKNQKYLSGYVKLGDELEPQEVRLMVFTNKYKSENEKAPDFVVYQAGESKAQKQEQNSVEEDLEELLK